MPPAATWQPQTQGSWGVISAQRQATRVPAQQAGKQQKGSVPPFSIFFFPSGIRQIHRSEEARPAGRAAAFQIPASQTRTPNPAWKPRLETPSRTRPVMMLHPETPAPSG